MLGNGFDLHYKLPTKYINFLNTVEQLYYLYKTKPESLTDVHSIGDLFGSERLQRNDAFITDSYQAYQKNYDLIGISFDIIETLARLPETNMWCVYLLKSLNRDIGWIDFEKEIGTVLSCFEKILGEKEVSILSSRNLLNRQERYIIEQFNFFIENKTNYVSGIPVSSEKIKKEYSVEYPVGSKVYIINDDLIINTLDKELKALADALKMYLSSFVESVAKSLIKERKIGLSSLFSYTDKVITLNYTNIYESFAPQASVIHIHGETGSNIVLGINANSRDELDGIDTSCLVFKKYYQRVLYSLDLEYIRFLLQATKNNIRISLSIMGHSLDITDKEIISDLFSLAKEIRIIYHSQHALAAYISNLVKIFGKDGFDALRYEKDLKFISIEKDCDQYLGDQGFNHFEEAFS